PRADARNDGAPLRSRATPLRGAGAGGPPAGGIDARRGADLGGRAGARRDRGARAGDTRRASLWRARREGRRGFLRIPFHGGGAGGGAGAEARTARAGGGDRRLPVRVHVARALRRAAGGG